MPPKTRIKKEAVIKAALSIVRNKGLTALNARDLARQLECSTQPIFRLYKNMDELKFDVKKGIDDYYQNFIQKHVVKEDQLLTISTANIEFAREERYYFEVIFLSELSTKRDVETVIQSSWNRETIELTAKQFNIDIEKAEALYRDIRFYTLGIAAQLYVGNLILDIDEGKKLIANAIKKFLTR